MVAALPGACRPVQDLLVHYLRERQSTVDYVTLQRLASTLGKLFWADLEQHHPGIDSLRLAPEVATSWKQRILNRESGLGTLATVRAFYLDIAQWAMEDPARWSPWAAVCPIRDEDMSRKKAHRQRKSRMDQRTRERLPVLPGLVTAVNTERRAAAELLQAAQATEPGEVFTAAGQTLRRRMLARPDGAARIWAEDPASDVRRDLSFEEHQSFWAWAAVEVLRHTGLRIEELCELSHHSFVQYTLPSTGELIPLLHIAPSKTDAERLLVISPELADVLSAIICRIRQPAGSVPPVAAYDYHEKVWNPPMPLLFQRHYGGERRPIAPPAIRRLLNHALAKTGFTDASGQLLRFLPHDFRRIFITDAVMNGMPPHIAQLVVGHRDINTTMGYKAVYPEEVINGHRAFIARRRQLRPSEEYRAPTDAEWEEFLGHFQRRKLALGDCGRAYSLYPVGCCC
ncbi:site-specific integrase [Saccharopolyspora sp. ASAGF58]|nr:site-specific integrase [Saccharopolyspora sp. ASAGF58]